MEERAVDSQTAYPSSKIQLPEIVQKEMADAEWMAMEQLKKPVQLVQANWGVTDAIDSDIVTFRFPAVLSTIDSIVTRTLSMYAFYKMTPIFRFQINATNFHQGQLICSWDPFSISSRTSTNRAVYSATYATGLPHVKIMASESNPVELKIPFIHPRSFLSTNVNDIDNNMGTIRVTVLNSLQAATGSTQNLSLTVWLYAEDATVHVPIYYHTPTLEPTSLLENILEEGKDLIMNKSVDIKDAVKNASDVVGNVITGNVGQALRKGQGLVDNLGNLFGFDYPANTISPDKCIMPVENLAVAKGKSRSQRLCIDPFSLYMISDDIAGETQMDFKQICKQTMLIRTFSFSETDTRGATLWNIPVTPNVSVLRNKSPNPNVPAPNFQRPYISYVSNLFTYWSGGIHYDIEIVATRFHSGKLLFAFVPNAVTTIPTYQQAIDNLPNVVVDIQQTSSTRFTVPFNSTTTVKQVKYLNPTANTPGTPSSDSITGYLVCYVVNTLSRVSNVAAFVSINLYISAADDFNLYVPSYPALDFYVPPPPTSTTVKSEGLSTQDLMKIVQTDTAKTEKPTEKLQTTAGISILNDKNPDTNTVAVLSKDQAISTRRPIFGENYSMIDSLRRFSPYSFDTPMGYQTANNRFSSYFVTPLVNSLIPNLAFDTYMSTISRLFSAFSGSIRYKFIFHGVRTDPECFMATHYPTPPFINNNDTDLNVMRGFANVLTTVCQDTSIEVEVPYYSKFNMLVLNGDSFGSGQYNNNGRLVISQTGFEATDQEVYDLWVAAGEDFRLHYLRPPPIDRGTMSTSIQSVASI